MAAFRNCKPEIFANYIFEGKLNYKIEKREK
jgi:hypothetical protein